MKLFFSPGACSLAPRIILEELGLPYEGLAVDMKTKTYAGGDFKAINPNGYVPTLKTEQGEILTEAAVILQYLAAQKPQAALFPASNGFEHFRALEWLNFIATEMHKGFGILFKPIPEDAKGILKDLLGTRLDHLSKHLTKNDFVLGNNFSIADAYLFTILNWSAWAKVDLAKWPVLTKYHARIKDRSSVQRALKAEGLS